MTDHTRPPLATLIEEDAGDFLEVLRMLAHRLSQPLTTLLGSIEVALSGEMDESECRKVLELSLQESHRMAEILQALRDILEMEGADAEVQPVSWTECVEKLLGEAAPGGEKSRPLRVSKMQEVWVRASPQHLGRATARLIAGAVRAAQARREVLVSLSARSEIACLSVCEEHTGPDAEASAGGFPALVAKESSVLASLDQWVVRRAIERQGGWLKISGGSEGRYCYELNLPLATPDILQS